MSVSLQVLRRIFPVGRGLYEDYLANFWCTTSVAIKWKSLLSNALLMPACAGLTVLVALPSMVQQMLQPSPRGLLLGMANSAFAFFMFSYQVRAGSDRLNSCGGIGRCSSWCWALERTAIGHCCVGGACLYYFHPLGAAANVRDTARLARNSAALTCCPCCCSPAALGGVVLPGA
jgi:hypothetical protein